MKLEFVLKKMREFSFDDSDYTTLQEITSEAFLEKAFEEVTNQIELSVNAIEDMSAISRSASEMVEFCQEEEIPLPDSKEDRIENAIVSTGNQSFITFDVLGDKEEYFSTVMANKEIMSAIIKTKLQQALTGNPNLLIVYPNTPAFKDYFEKSGKTIRKYKSEVLAILDDRTLFFDTDVLLTTTGMLILERNTLKEICSYKDVAYDNNTGKLTLGSINYHHNSIDTPKMYEALVELKQAALKR